MDMLVEDSGATASHRYFAFGLTIASEFPLPELVALHVPPVGEPDVLFHHAALPQVPSGMTVGEDGEVNLSIDKVGRYRIRGGREIAVCPLGGAPERDVRLFLLGSAFGALCHQRGLMPLHANAVVFNGRAFAFAGPSGIGKSTLAAYFRSRGLDVLCDDVCVVSFDAQGRPLAWPGLPRLKLWEEAAQAFGYDSAELERAVEGLEKYHVPLTGTALKGSYPLAALYVLDDAAQDGVIAKLAGPLAVSAVLTNVYRGNYLQAMGLARGNFERAVRLCHHADIFAASRRRGYDVFAQEAAKFEHHIMQQAPRAYASPEGSFA
jgi:hypothetical protein